MAKDPTSLPNEFNGYRFSGELRPHQKTAKRMVPDHIQKPDYELRKKIVEDKNLKINLKDPVSPVLIEDMSDKNSYYVIMLIIQRGNLK